MNVTADLTTAVFVARTERASEVSGKPEAKAAK